MVRLHRDPEGKTIFRKSDIADLTLNMVARKDECEISALKTKIQELEAQLEAKKVIHACTMIIEPLA